MPLQDTFASHVETGWVEAGVMADQGFGLLEGLARRILREEIASLLGQREWVDQEHSGLGRNTFIRACHRLVRADSPHVTHDGDKWLMRACALDQVIVQRNRGLVEQGRIPESEPPPAMNAPLAKAEPEDETGVYDRNWLERLRGAR